MIIGTKFFEWNFKIDRDYRFLWGVLEELHEFAN